MTGQGRRKQSGFALAATFALAVFPAAHGAAQTVPVDAGEHDGFTRLVIRIGAGRDWQLEQADQTWRLSLDPGLDGFDLTGSFDFIQRRRVAGLSQETGTLILELACDCSVSAFRHRDTFLVIDVADAPASGEASSAESESVEPTPLRPSAQQDAAPNVRSTRRQAAAALPDLARLLTPGPASLEDGPAQRNEPPPTPLETTPPETTRPDLEEAAQIMAEQFARAAAAGLLEPAAGMPLDFADPRPTANEVDIAQPPPQVEAEATGAPPPETLATAPRQPERTPSVDASPARILPADPPILARNAFDIAAAPIPDAAPVQRRLECVGRVYPLVDPADAARTDDEDRPGLGELRRAVFDDRDRLVEDAVLRLASYYLERGFGAEAVFWLTRLEEPPEDLIAIARMADGLDAEAFPVVFDASACSDQELVFRYLGGAMNAPLVDTEAHRIQRAFAAFPGQLQRQFGPRIARRLSEEGHTGTARNLRDMLRQTGLIPEAEMLTLEFDLGLTPPAPQLDSAMSLALRDDGATAAATMSRSLALDRREGILPDPDRLVAAEALLRETPAGDDADLLWREIAIAHARLGQVDAALAALIDGRDRTTEVWQSAVTSLVADRLSVEDGATLLLLAYLVGEDWTATGSEAGRTRVAASRYLAQSGLAEAATQLSAGRPALALPVRDPADGTAPVPSSGWSEGIWAENAETLSGPEGDIARRLDAREDRPDALTPLEAGNMVDLDALSARVADSRALRDAALAILGEQPPAARDEGGTP